MLIRMARFLSHNPISMASLYRTQILRFVPLSSFIQQNGMSQYPNYYVQPVYKKETQEELTKSGELYKYTHVPTRAALNDQTSSASNDPLVNLFINYVMKDGKKVLARSVMEKTFENVKRLQLERYHKCENPEDKEKIELNPKTIFHRAVENCKPILALSPIKRGGVKYQVPVPITAKKAQFMSMKWLIEAGKDKHHEVRFALQLARELIDASNNKGRVIKRKHELHKQCEANRAYAHYRWS
ncbi:small ribosomal subunit protein uS7m [Cylas formicarius]|uniref:small ribosomal subunit protein uS7m n=1 Tax=Cylas formicarius TaxID=197179 RepID=UPI00295882C0|nr:small ribosomal subunit protein uS7m [Cylas formicarius]